MRDFCWTQHPLSPSPHAEAEVETLDFQHHFSRGQLRVSEEWPQHPDACVHSMWILTAFTPCFLLLHAALLVESVASRKER